MTAHWVINGSKQFITNSGTDITKLVTVTAVTGETDGRKEISSILVPVRTQGFTAEPAYNKVGWNASDTHPLSFDDVRVPAGEPARRARPRLRQLPAHPRRGPHRDRRVVRRRRTGLRRRVREVRQGTRGLRCGDRHAIRPISFKIARMEARAYSARTAYYDAAALMLAGKPFKKAAAIAKLVASEAAMDNARDATQVFGGYGFMNEYPVARHYRDSKILEIGEGTTEVQLMLIARARLGCDRQEDRRPARPVVRGVRAGVLYQHRPAAPSPRPTTCCSPR